MRCTNVITLSFAATALQLVVALGTPRPRRAPNVILVLADDVGWADVSFTSQLTPAGPGLIPTPSIDALARRGVVLPRHYSQSTCTPARAALLSGRFAANTGLTMAMLPGSVAGLPRGMLTLPRLLRDGAGYRAHQVGKHHVGHAQWRQTPVGLGFETHVGSYLWSMEYFRKGLWELPWEHFALDWVRAHENGTFSHYAEPRHTTNALTEEAIAVMERHARKGGGDPLFLYVAYTAAHAPLEPLAEDLADCGHLQHTNRRLFCGLIRGLDRGVGRLAQAAERLFDNNVLFIFSSDNGGAPWFGGGNAPLRSGKTMPFEGGVRVPTFIVDFRRPEAATLSGAQGLRTYDGVSHVADILPTLAGFAGIELDGSATPGLDQLDGRDLSAELWPAPQDGRASRWGEDEAAGARTLLLEMSYGLSKQESLFPEDIVALRSGRWKYISAVGGLRDDHWYRESVVRGHDGLNSTDPSLVTRLAESALAWLESWTTSARFDTIRDLAVHLGVQAMFRGRSAAAAEARGDTNGNGTAAITLLFDVEADPEERINRAAEFPAVVAKLRRWAEDVAARRPPQQQYWMTVDRATVWPTTLVAGDCSKNRWVATHHHAAANQCLFAHPWIPDETDLEKVPLVFGASAVPFLRSVAAQAVHVLVVPLALTAAALAVLGLRRFGTGLRKCVGISVLLAIAYRLPYWLSHYYM